MILENFNFPMLNSHRQVCKCGPHLYLVRPKTVLHFDLRPILGLYPLDYYPELIKAVKIGEISENSGSLDNWINASYWEALFHWYKPRLSTAKQGDNALGSVLSVCPRWGSRVCKEYTLWYTCHGLRSTLTVHLFHCICKKDRRHYNIHLQYICLSCVSGVHLTLHLFCRCTTEVILL